MELVGRVVTVHLAGPDGRPAPAGRFNVANALVAAAVATALGRRRGRRRGRPRRRPVGARALRGRRRAVRRCRGRRLRPHPGRPRRALRAVRALAGDGRVLCVFGCGGDRDRGKRPAMGAVASRLADVVVVTSDNPRSEDPLAIIDEVASGMTGTGRGASSSRTGRAAIRLAVGLARPGDVVLVAGKGHETHPDDRGDHRRPSTTGWSPRRPWPSGSADRGRRPMIPHDLGRRRPVGRRADHAVPHPLAAQRHRPADPRGRAPDPHRQGRHADDGRDLHRRAVVVGYLSATSIPGVTFTRDRRPGAVGHRRRGGHRLRRRLDQGAPPPQPRAQQAGQVRRPDGARRRASRSWP